MWQTIGQDKAVFLLQRSLETDQLANAYLFVGPRHVGKANLALELAQALNCDAKKPPCGQCLSCTRILSGIHADVSVVGTVSTGVSRLKSEIGIDQIREMQHSASLPPFEGRYKVFIIDGAERLSVEAANCLLKTLEEAWGNLLFILLTSDERFILPTIVSRCQRIELPPVSTDTIIEALQNGLYIEASRAHFLATLSHGRLGWALLAVNDENMVAQRVACIRDLVNIIRSDYVDRFTFATQLATQFNQTREIIYDMFELWLYWWRDLLLVNIKNEYMVMFADDYAMVAQLAAIFSINQIRGVIRNIEAAKVQLQRNANPRLVLEVLLLNIPRLSNVEQVT